MCSHARLLEMDATSKEEESRDEDVSKSDESALSGGGSDDESEDESDSSDDKTSLRARFKSTCVTWALWVTCVLRATLALWVA